MICFYIIKIIQWYFKNDNIKEGPVSINPAIPALSISVPAHMRLCVRSLRAVYVQWFTDMAISKNIKANLIAHKHKGRKRVGHLTSLPSLLPPLLSSLVSSINVCVITLHV